MYCRKCNNLMDNEEIICTKCGCDNTQEFSYTTNILESNENSERIRKLKLSIFIVIVFIVSVMISLYIFSDSKKSIDKKTDDKNTTQETSKFDSEFNFQSIKVKYPSDIYGTSTNTIFYKNNHNYKIEFKLVNENEYSKVNLSELIDSKLGKTATKMGDIKDGYTHLFTLNNQHYLITVNYDFEDTLSSLERQLELTKIISTLEEKIAY